MGWQRSHADTLATYLVGTKVNPDSIAMRQAWECFKRCVEQRRTANRLQTPAIVINRWAVSREGAGV